MKFITRAEGVVVVDKIYFCCEFNFDLNINLEFLGPCDTSNKHWTILLLHHNLENEFSGYVAEVLLLKLGCQNTYQENTFSKLCWIKYSTIHHVEVMGKDVVVMGDGCFIAFFNITTGQCKYYRANSKAVGDGVRYTACHKSYNIFAFAEKCYNPRILILSYPDFTRVATLSDAQRFGYLKLLFADSDFLISLSTFPNYDLIIWNWRTGEKINSIKTNILNNNQMIRAILSNSVLSIAQCSIVNNELSVWELLICCKKSVLREKKVTHSVTNSFSSCLWTTEGTLFVTDKFSNIYMMNSKSALEIVISVKEEGPNIPLLTWLKGGLLVFGPNSKFKHYKKSGSWILDWEVDCPEPFKRLTTMNRDLLCISTKDNMYTFNSTENTFNLLTNHDSGFNEICIVYPMGTHIVSLAHNSELALWGMETGALVDVMPLQKTALYLKENPEFPYVAVSYEQGLLDLVSVYDPEKLKLLTTFNLTKNPLSSIYFTEVGRLLVTADLDVGQFFVIQGNPGSKMQVLATVTAEKQIADYILVASKSCLRLFAIVVTSQNYIAGNKIIRYCIMKDKNPEYKEYHLEESTMLYSNLYATKLSNRDRVFYATPLTTKCIHQIETKRGDDYARIINTILTKHQMKNILYHSDNYHSISYAYDGLIFIYSDFLETDIYTLLSHHRMNGGIKNAYVDPHSKHVVSIDRRNMVVCITIDAVKVNPGKVEKLKELHFSPTNEMMFKYPTIGFLPKGELLGKTWLEVEEINLREKERLICLEERNDILQKFEIIKLSVQKLLTANLEGPENEKLNIQEFNIDLEMKNLKLQKSKENCEKTKAYLLALIEAQDKGESIYALYENYDVTNYVLLFASSYNPETLGQLKSFRYIEEILACNDMFKTWFPIEKGKLKEKLAQQPSFKIEETPHDLLQIVEDEDEDIKEEDKEEKIRREKENNNAYFGNVAHNYVDLQEAYDQFEIQTFDQVELQKLLTHLENFSTKTYFNKHFEVLKSIKEREMIKLKESIARLRHIISEINYFSKNKLSVIIQDPEVHQEEYPERLLQVEENEMAITPYISPSEQARLDAEAAEAERIRLLLLADDFRERALMAMMNGVLEIRWEDELRKEVPKPKCMLEKEPEDFNEEDLRTVRAYEIDVAFLHSERERYKILLEAEYGKIAQNVRESIQKFNNRLDELYVLKLKIDSSINQHSLRMNRKKYNYYKEILMLEEEAKLEQSIIKTDHQIEKTQKLISSLYETLNESRGHHDSLMAKEKILEKNLRKDFAETSPVLQDQVQKLYKKRPKTNIRSALSSSVLLELARAIVTHDKPKILSNECIEYLKAIDNLDMYVGISNTVDENSYALLCKHRRLRIENELKMKAQYTDITEGENTIAIFQKAIADYKEAQAGMITHLTNVRTEKLLAFQNIEIQMVLKGGITEIPLTGFLKDFDDAILVPRKEVEEINKIIIKVGQKKIKAMEDVMKFKRGILSKEWEHRRLQMRIHDLKTLLTYIHSIKVTKEIQAYLKIKSRGDKEEKITFEQQIELVKKSYIRIIDEMKTKVNELQERINVIKKENKILNKKITAVNVDVCEFKLEFDYEMDQKEKDMMKLRMNTLLKRAKLVKEIQNNHNEILVLQTELELLRLKTFPTLKYKLFN